MDWRMNQKEIPVKPVYQGLDGRFIDVTNIRCGLPWFIPKYHAVRIDESECIHYDPAFNRLYGIDDHCDGTWMKLFKRL